MLCTCNQLVPPGKSVADVCLGQSWLFSSLSPTEIEALLAAAQRRQLPSGGYVFLQGEPARLLFVIKAGRIKLTKTDAEGNNILVDIRKAGDFLGETFLSDDTDYPLTAECVEDSLLCGITRERFERLVTENPSIGLKVMRAMSERIDWLTTRVGDLSSTRLEERLYAVLTTVAREHGTATQDGLQIGFPLTHEELSFLVGAHRVSVTKALKALSVSGKVVRQGGHLLLPAR
ncbi:MAG: Crp/Fnr family transcriptional regulator [Thermoleophilia bacterium]|nr:Crp/Fnr family transcriptional regulator [Thermoleophilia bacterium]